MINYKFLSNMTDNISCYQLNDQMLYTIATYVVGIGFYHKLNGHADPTREFLVSKLLEGCRRGRRLASRQPLTHYNSNTQAHFAFSPACLFISV